LIQTSIALKRVGQSAGIQDRINRVRHPAGWTGLIQDVERFAGRLDTEQELRKRWLFDVPQNIALPADLEHAMN
jgi:hypothetical protein